MARQMQQLGALSMSPPKEYRPSKVREDRPAYMVTGTGFFDKKDQFLFAGQELYWDDEPNANFIPINKMAYDKMQEYLDKLDALGLKRAKKDGKEYVPIARQAWVEGGVEELPLPDSVFGADKSQLPNDVIR